MAGNLLDPRRLIHVEKRRAEEDERRNDDARDHDRRLERLIRRAAEDERENALTEEDDDRERREGPEHVDVMGAGEPPRPPKGSPDPERLDEQHRDDEPERR